MQSPNTFSLSFWIDSTRAKNNEATVFARITVNSKRENISLKRKVSLSEWDSNKCKARGNKQESRLLNRYLDQVKNRVYQAHDELVKEKAFISAQSIKARFLGEDEEEYLLLTLIDYHNTQLSESLSYGTLKNYFTTQRYIKKFLTEKRKIADIYLSQLTYRFLVDFEKFLRTHVPEDHQKPMGNNTVMKHIQRLRKMVTLAYKMEWIDKDPFIKFKPHYIRKEREFLREDELQSIIEKNFEFERLELVKDLFIFSCYTGLAYIDVMKLNEDLMAYESLGTVMLKQGEFSAKIKPKSAKYAEIVLQVQDKTIATWLMLKR